MFLAALFIHRSALSPAVVPTLLRAVRGLNLKHVELVTTEIGAASWKELQVGSRDC